MQQHSNYRVPRRREKEESEKICEEIIVKNFPNMGKEIVKVQEVQSPIQDKAKEKHTEIHTNQNSKD